MAKRMFNSPKIVAVFTAIENQINTGGLFATNYRTAVKEFDLDTKLRWLVGAIGQIANGVGPRHGLLHAAAIAWVWLESFGIKPLNVSSLIAEERLRQQELYIKKALSFRCDSPLVDTNRKLRVLIEEIGEVAQAIDYLETHPIYTQNGLQTELVQVAAVSVAWLESMEPEAS